MIDISINLSRSTRVYVLTNGCRIRITVVRAGCRPERFSFMANKTPFHGGAISSVNYRRATQNLKTLNDNEKTTLFRRIMNAVA